MAFPPADIDKLVLSPVRGLAVGKSDQFVQTRDQEAPVAVYCLVLENKPTDLNAGEKVPQVLHQGQHGKQQTGGACQQPALPLVRARRG